MKFITSISPKRIKRQRYCINSWIKHGNVVAIQAEHEIQELQPQFPQVQFIACSQIEEDSSRVNICAMIKQGPGLLINSDIKIESTQEEFNIDWEPKPKQFNVGVRYDFDGPGEPKTLNKYGIDAFLITEEIINAIEDHGFVIGIPVWDYWIIWHMITKGFKIKTKRSPGLLHLNHPMGWPMSDMPKGMEIMKRDYGIGQKTLNLVIGDITDRLNVITNSRNTPYEA